MDVVFDTVGGDTFQRAFATLKKGGFLVTSVAFPKDEARQHGVNMVEAGEVKTHVSKVLPFAEIKRPVPAPC